MHSRVLALVLSCGAACLAAEPPAVEEIMARVAANQEKAVEARNGVIYHQSTWTRLLRGNGKLAREEKRQYTVTPTANGTKKDLVHFEGRYEKGGKLLGYDDPKFRHKDLDLDGDLAEELTDDLVNDKKSRDGIARDVFPLTKDEQRYYTFHLAGTQKVGGVEAWKVTFEPIKKNKKDEVALENERCWSGEVLVDPAEFQPLVISTKMAFKIPTAAKVLLGINLKQVGFNVTYRKVDEGLWFPATYGTEFWLRVFFGYGRTITLNMENSDFRLARAESTITYETPMGTVSAERKTPPDPR
jgi:hypothetical protein